jgi:hypothetical protein
MGSNLRLLEDKPKAVVFVCLGVLTLHLINASLFHLERSLDERIAWAALALFTAVVATLSYSTLNNPARGLVALAFGLSGLVAGIAIHAVHVAQMGVLG